MTRSMLTLSHLLVAVLLGALLMTSPAHATLITGGFNIDGGDPVTSNQTTFGGFPITNINDGNGGNFWLPTSGPPSDATIDLGRNYRITDLNLTNSLFSQRATNGFTVTASTTGAFTGEQVTVASSNLPVTGTSTDIPVTANQVGRYIRFTATSIPGGDFNPGLAELSLGGVPNRATVQLQPYAPAMNSISAQAFTRTANQTDTAATWSLYAVTPTSGSIVQSVGKTVTTSTIDYGAAANITNGINDIPTNEVLFSQTVQPDLSVGDATVNLGQRMIIDNISLLNTTYNGNATKNYRVFAANNLADFDDPNYTNVLSSAFTVPGETDSFTLTNPIIGQYVRFVALDWLTSFGAFRAGLDELTITGRTFTTTLLASGSGAVGDSSNFGTIGLGSNLPYGPNLLALDANTSDGLNRETLQSVFAPEPASAGLLLVGGTLLLRRRRA